MEKEYSITGEELGESMCLVSEGYKCKKYEVEDTLFVRLEKDGIVKEFEFVPC